MFHDVWYDDRYWSKILHSTIPTESLGPVSSHGQGHRLRTFMLKSYVKDFRTSLFPNPLMDLVHVWYDDRYWSKFYTLPFPPLYMTLELYVKVLHKIFKTRLFLNPMIYLVHIWYGDRYWFKILCSTIPTPIHDLKVKVTDLESLC